MKNISLTAGQIYSKMHNLRQETKDLNRTLDIVMKECGSDSKPYKIIKQMREEKSMESMDFESKMFVEIIGDLPYE